MSDEYEANRASQIVLDHLGKDQVDEKKYGLLHLSFSELIILLQDTKYADWQAEILKRLNSLINEK